MTQDKSGVVKLSANVKKMKFMQRGLTDDERQKLDENEKQVITREHWELDIPPIGKESSKFEIVSENYICEKHRHSRLSYGGFNKAIEKLMIELNQEGNGDKEQTDDVDDVNVSDKEMTDWFASCSTLVGTVAKKFKAKSGKEKMDGKNRKRFSPHNSNDIPSKVHKAHSSNVKTTFLKPSCEDE